LCLSNWTVFDPEQTLVPPRKAPKVPTRTETHRIDQASKGWRAGHKAPNNNMEEGRG